MPKISLCMICRNEARLLPGCLESARPAVDEIVVIDTGSTDDTRKIARDHGAAVITAAWHDFSTTRNQALNRATGDWVLVLDADEELLLETPDKLRQLAAANEAEAYAARIINSVEMTEFVDVEKSPQFFAIRFFKRAGAVYVNPVYERLVLPPGARVSQTGGFDIVHYGFLPELAARRKTRERNFALVERWLAEESDNPWALMYMGRHLHETDRLDEAIAFYAKALPGLVSAGESATVVDTYKNLADCYRSAGRAGEAGKLLAQGVLTYPSSVDLRFAYGRHLLNEDSAEAAVEQFAACLELIGENAAQSEAAAPFWTGLAESFTALRETGKAAVSQAIAGPAGGTAVGAEETGDKTARGLVEKIRSREYVLSEVLDYLLEP